MRKLALAVLAVVALSALALGQGAVLYPNATSTGTTLNSLAAINSSGQAVLATTSQTAVQTYIVVGGNGTAGSAALAIAGAAACTMDATVASGGGGYFVIASTTTAGDCHPQAAAPAAGTWVVGFLQPASTSSGVAANVVVCNFFEAGSGGGNMSDGSGTTTAGIIPFSTSTGHGYTVGDLWGSPYYVPAANCNNTSAGAGWSIGNGGTVTCRAGTNDLGGFIAITDTSSTFAQFQVNIPEDWDTATNPQIRFFFAYPGTDGSSSHTVIPNFQISCAKGDGSTSDDVSFNAAHSSSTITLSSATANLFFSGSHIQMNSTDMTGCVAGSMMIVKVGRATDTATSAANMYGVSITFPHLTPGVAGAN